MRLCVDLIFQNKEISSLPASLERGELPALVSGLSAVHRANLAAALKNALGLPLVAIVPDEAGAESMARDLTAMLSEPVNIIAGRDFTFYETVAASRQAEQKRLEGLYKLASGAAEITVVTMSGLLQRAMPPAVMEKAGFLIRASEAYAIEDIMDALLRCGYTVCDQVEGPGQFSRRGGILDFYSPAYSNPVRIEFWGDDIDSMGLFDTGSQRRVESLSECMILPAAETLISLSEGGRAALGAKIGELAEKFGKKKGSEQALSLMNTCREDGEKILNGVNISDADRYLPLIYPFATAMDYIPADAFIFFDQPSRCQDRAREYIKQLCQDVKELNRRGTVPSSPENFYDSFESCCKKMAEFPVYMADAFTMGKYPIKPKSLHSLSAKQLPSYAGSPRTAAEDVALYLRQKYRVIVLAGDSRRAAVLRDFFAENDIEAGLFEALPALPDYGKCSIAVGSLSAGLEYPGIKTVILTDAQMMRVKDGGRTRRKAAGSKGKLTSYTDLNAGDLVVHEHHGIGRFSGIVKMTVDGFEKDYMKISYAGADCLYVPCTQLDLVSKYIGAGGEDRPVKLSKMGGTDWNRSRSRAKAAAKDLAKGLIALYAQRLREPGHAFSPDSAWQQEFEENFGYDETEDQLRCINEIKADMEKSMPMDRLLCGDVGYGKTEVALRAVMKCILDGKQAALLCPTTVLARQHFQTAQQRFFGFPADIELMSRFQTGAELKRTLKNLETGKCDFVIGTHRLLQKDIKFKNLGLLVVDEEQRFGVSHKEHIKEMSRGVDVLTLSATPIPRTLNMAMSGIRDMSTIEEPPQDRMPVQTFVLEHNWDVLSDAIRRELNRGGQVFYLHNRIDTIEKTTRKLREILGDDVTIAAAHGQMDKEMLASVMEGVSEGRTQILVCTTIIETGIDIPNVNTLIIEDADKMGLSQLHQIRGRVGRSTRKASAYLTFKPDKVLTEVQEKRLSAIREFAEFGSGFKIAMRDLEIRGAGNLLGAEQSGHMIDVGYDMYLKLLEEAVLEEKGIKGETRCECSADLAVAANIPDRYVPSQEQRMDIYRRIALIRTEEDADDLTDELIDRFGDPPGSVNSLIYVALLRGEAARARISDITQKNGQLRFTVEDFEMARVSEMYAMEDYNGRLRVEAGSKPCLSLRLLPKARVIDISRKFVADWAATEHK